MDMVTKKPVVAPTEVVPRARRRTFNLAFKRKILTEADAAADEPGKVAALLRRHGLYSSHLTEGRRARDAGLLGGATSPRRGPVPASVQVDDAERTRELERQFALMTLSAERAEMLVAVQKNLRRCSRSSFRRAAGRRDRTGDSRRRAASPYAVQDAPMAEAVAAR
jgi:transposase